MVWYAKREQRDCADRHTTMAATSDGQTRRLSVAWRLYLYALHGYLIEVTFTAVWDLVVSGSLELRGFSSVWSLGIYSISCMAMEKINGLLQRRGLAARALAHTCWIYVWEFTTGSFLKALGSCPWDYRHFRYNVCGLVTLEYAPLWFLCGLLFELLLVPNVQRLVWACEQSAVDVAPVRSPRNGYITWKKE
ncbi:hypothetical protein MRX96_033555 [Rhipicephalus microplus]